MERNKPNNRETLAQYIDHTQLSPEATEAQIDQLCAEARQYAFKSVCVEPQWVSHAKSLLEGTDVLICTVVSFPKGDDSPEKKFEQTRKVIGDGAQEVDMVLNRTFLKEGLLNKVMEDISAVVRAAQGVTTKVILETCELTQKEIVRACELCKEAGAQFVKTSTGFSTGGANVEDVALMRKTVGPEMGVKASGGIRTLQDALAMIEAGASRLGMSASVAVMKELG